MEPEKTVYLTPPHEEERGVHIAHTDIPLLEMPKTDIPCESAHGSDMPWQGTPYDGISWGYIPWQCTPYCAGATWFAQYMVSFCAYDAYINALCCLSCSPNCCRCCPCQ